MNKIAFKKQQVTTLVELLAGADFYLMNSEGLTAGQMAELRGRCRSHNIICKMVKNSLLAKALEKMALPPFESLSLVDLLKGNSTLFVSHGAPKQTAQLVLAFHKEKNELHPLLKAAYVDQGLYVGVSHLTTLATLRSKEELLGQILFALQAPMPRIFSATQGILPRILAGVKAKAEKA